MFDKELFPIEENWETAVAQRTQRSRYFLSASLATLRFNLAIYQGDSQGKTPDLRVLCGFAVHCRLVWNLDDDEGGVADTQTAAVMHLLLAFVDFDVVQVGAVATAQVFDKQRRAVG